MKTTDGTVNQAVYNAIRTSNNINAAPRLTAEWNLNRYYDVTPDNIIPEYDNAYDAELMPIESIIQANRPTKGVCKARVGQGALADAAPALSKSRFYTSSVDDVYKYWCSPVTTDSGGNFPLHTDGSTVVRPYIAYSKIVQANKVVVKIENTWSQPLSYSIMIQTTVGGSWSTISTNPTINNKTGIIEIYYNGVSWSTTKTTGVAQTTAVAGVMFKVNSLRGGKNMAGTDTTYYSNGTTKTTTGANNFFNLIEIAACRYEDMSNKLISVNDTFDMAEKSVLYPIGTTTANVANLVLANYDGEFNADNTLSVYSGIAKENVQFNLEYIYNVEGVEYPVQQFNMYSGPWNGTKDDQVNIDLRDFSKFFDEAKPSPALYQDLTVAEIIWRLCDVVGFVNYAVQSDDLSSPVVPWFWSDGEKTMWELLNELSLAFQIAIYFDSNGVLQIRTPTQAFKATRAVDWVLRGQSGGTGNTELADISSLDQSDVAETNSVTVNYYKTDITHKTSGALESLDVVWQPSETVTLRSSVVRRNVTINDTYIAFASADAAIWPYNGILQVQAEIIRYEGKRFRYVNAAGNLAYANVKSKEEKDIKDTEGPVAKRYQNGFTGELVVKTRGLWNSEIKAHNVDAAGYSTRNVVSGVAHAKAAGFSHAPYHSTVKLAPNFASGGDLLLSTRGGTFDAPFKYYGTRLRFNGDRRDQQGGLVINNGGSLESGYYIELKLSSKVDRLKRNELIVFSRQGNTVTGYGGAGQPAAIGAGIWYNLDVAITSANNNHTMKIYLNGRLTLTTTVPAAQSLALNGKHGMFARGQSDIDFEYIYGVIQPEGEEMDGVGFFDSVLGNYVGTMWDTEWVYKWRNGSRRTKKGVKKIKERYANLRIDEFGPYAHEIREFSIKFDPSPVLHSKVMLSNSGAILSEYIANSFGAKFIVANIRRENTVIQGQDSLGIAGTGDSINQVFLVFGRTVKVADVATVVTNNDAQIKAYGKIESSIDSPWVQSEDAAKKISNWIISHWSIGADEQTVTIFGNPLIEVGDLVSVNYADKNMAESTHKYFVLSASTDFSQGLETTLVLRRKIG